MNTRLPVIVTLVILLGTAAAFARSRTWTDAQGRKTRGTFVRVNNGGVVLKLTNGNVITVPFRQLSEADQDYLREELAAKGEEDQLPPKESDDEETRGTKGFGSKGGAKTPPGVPPGVAPGSAPPGAAVPGAAVPGAGVPGAPGSRPPMTMPPGGGPPGRFPPGFGPGRFPPGVGPQTGAIPGSGPPGVPPGVPPGTAPTGPGALPGGAFPPGTTPPGSIPSNRPPTTPPGSPPGMMPNSSSPPGGVPFGPGTNVAGTAPPMGGPPGGMPTGMPGSGIPQMQFVETKMCMSCGKEVSSSAKAGDRCPHCGIYWGYEDGANGKRNYASGYRMGRAVGGAVALILLIGAGIKKLLNK